MHKNSYEVFIIWRTYSIMDLKYQKNIQAEGDPT